MKAKGPGPRHRKVPSPKHGWSDTCRPPGEETGGDGTGSPNLRSPIRPLPHGPPQPPRV